MGTKQLLLACEEDAQELQEAFRSRLGFRKMSDRQVRLQPCGEGFLEWSVRKDFISLLVVARHLQDVHSLAEAGDSG